MSNSVPSDLFATYSWHWCGSSNAKFVYLYNLRYVDDSIFRNTFPHFFSS